MPIELTEILSALDHYGVFDRSTRFEYVKMLKIMDGRYRQLHDESSAPSRN